ncbi:MAG: hypothetical protein V1839_02890 [archaeon]
MVDFSFEDIHELLRSEKYSSDLQPLNEEQLAQINHYLGSKRALLNKQRDSALFENNPDDKLRDELDNANRALKDFYDRREKKIITRAIFTARSLSKLRDTTNMLRSEEMIYDNLVNILKNSWAGFFSYFDSRLKECNAPAKSEVLDNNKASSDELASHAAHDKAKSDDSASHAAHDKASSDELASHTSYDKPLNNVSRDFSVNPQASGLMRLQFTDEIPELLDSELKRWGPFVKDQVAEIPAELASLLLKQSKAAEVKI